MNEELRLHFVARLFAVARERTERATAGLDRDDAELVRSELHALAGEAHMLGETAMADAAIRGESAASAWSGGAADQRAVTAESLREIAALIERAPA